MRVLLVPLGKDTIDIIKTLTRNGVGTYIVGGFVRDVVMGCEPGDVDIAVSDFDKAVEALKKAGFKVSEEARCFRVVKVYTGNGYVDVAGFRQETYDYRTRKPVVAPAKTIYEDLARRDFTINAMALEVLGIRDNTVQARLIDPYNGLADIRRRIIRAVGNPRVRFLEDPLRIMRMIRFAAKLRFRIDDNTFKAAVELRGEMKRISWERIRDELFKSLDRDPYLTVKILNAIGLYSYIFGGTCRDTVLQRLHRLRGGALSALALVFYTMGYTGDRIGRVMQRLRTPSAWIRTVKHAVRIAPIMIDAVKTMSPAKVAEALVEIGEDREAAEAAVRVAEAVAGTHGWLARVVNTMLSTPRRITGYDAIRAGIPPTMRSAWLKKQRINEMIQHYRSTYTRKNYVLI